MIDELKDVGKKGVTRRRFIESALAATAALGAVGCSETSVSESSADAADEAANIDDEGEWVTVSCWHNCGGGCFNQALVKDGVVIRQKTDDQIEDTWDNPQQRSCLRGRSQRKQCFGADRLKYPMKRKGWSVDNPNGQLRGKDEWERISWDDALELIYQGLKKALEEVGPSSILCLDDANWGAGTIWKLFPNIPEIGGVPTIVWDTASEGTYCLNMQSLGLPDFDLYPYMAGSISASDKFELLNADTVIMHGGNPVWASAGNRMTYFLEAKKHGAEFIYVGPSYNLTASAVDAKWIRVRPGTDVALLLAVAYTMVVEDDPETNPLIDWDFLKKYTVGFTMDNLPADAKKQECLMDYLLGKYDGIPKTPEWATEICGTPVEDIEYYAHALTMQKNVMCLHSFSAARNKGAEDFPQMFLTAGLLGGHVGKPGNAIGTMFNFTCGDNGPNFLSSYSPWSAPAVNNLGGECINATQLWDAVIDGKYNYVGMPVPINLYEPSQERAIDIRVILGGETAGMQTRPAAMRAIEAFRKVDMVVSPDMFMTTQARYSDIVLPVVTQWETWNQSMFRGARESIFFSRPVTEPLYEAKEDAWICAELLKKFGVDPTIVFPAEGKAAWMSKVQNTTLLQPDGSMIPLVTLSQEELDEYGCPGEPQEGLITLDDVMTKGKYQVMRSAEDQGAYRWISYGAFFADPDNNPLPSASGKFEIYCQWKADTLNNFGFNDTVTYKPYPTYTLSGFGYEASFTDWEKKEKGEYPYLCYQPHYLRRSHSTFNNIEWLRESFVNPVFINAADAAEKGIVDGDTVLIWNEFGKVLRRATVLESIMPGVIGLPHGSWLDLDEETGIDHGGMDNVLSGPITSATGVSGYNNYLVNFEKYTDEELLPDCEWPQRIIEL